MARIRSGNGFVVEDHLYLDGCYWWIDAEAEEGNPDTIDVDTIVLESGLLLVDQSESDLGVRIRSNAPEDRVLVMDGSLDLDFE